MTQTKARRLKALSLGALLVVGVVLVADSAPPQCENRDLDVSHTLETDCGGENQTDPFSLALSAEDLDKNETEDLIVSAFAEVGLEVTDTSIHGAYHECKGGDGDVYGDYTLGFNVGNFKCWNIDLEAGGTITCDDSDAKTTCQFTLTPSE